MSSPSIETSADSSPRSRWTMNVWRLPWARSLGTARYHGMWAPGIHWFRNRSLGVKGASVLLCLLLPVVLLAVELGAQRFSAAQRQQGAALSLGRLAALAELSRSTRALGSVLRGRPGADAAPVPWSAAKADEQRAHEAVSQVFRDTRDDPGMAGLVALLQQRREAFLAAAGEGGTATGETARAAYRAYVDGQALLRRRAAAGLDPEDAREQALLRGLLGPLPDLLEQIEPMSEWTARWLDDPAQSALAGPIAQHLGVARWLLREARPSLDEARRRGDLDPALFEAALQPTESVLAAVEHVLTLRAAGGEVTAAAGLPSAQTVLADADRAAKASMALHHAAQDLMQARQRQLAAEQRAEMQRLLALMAASLALIAYVLVSVYKVTAGGLRTLCAHLEQLGAGNLSIRAQGWGTDEVGRALNALGRATAQMSRVFEAVSQGVQAVAHTSREVAEGNGGLSGRTHEIHAAVAAVADRADTFSGAMGRCAAQVGDAAGLVHEMQGDAQRSRKAMRLLDQHMQALQARSREIEKTVALMENVAYQTKLLSINASVEAARAGGAGKGFSIVAQEVRTLAQRSEEAARRIHDIVQGSVLEIEEGHRVADRAQAAVSATEQRIDAIHALIGDIVHLTRDTQSGSQEVLSITRNASVAADGNARLVDQLSEASSALRSQGDHLKRSLQHFEFG